MFLLAVWTLILTAPIHYRWSIVSKWCNVKFIQISSDEVTNPSTPWMAWEWAKFQQIFIFEWTIPLNTPKTSQCVYGHFLFGSILKPVLYFPCGQSGRVHGQRRRGLLVFILLKVYAGGPLCERVPYMRSRSASTVNKHVNKQLPRVIAHLAVFILFYRWIVQVWVATGFFTQPAHAQLVLL